MKAILTWHAIEDMPSPISVGAATFADQVAFLASQRVRVTSLGGILDADDDAVALTFDDAFTSFTERAWPMLRDAGLPVTVFVVADCVGGRNRWSGRAQPGIPDLPLADWDALARAAAEGAEIGCHSRRHPRLDAIDDGALAEETSGAFEILQQRLGVAPTSYCYPYGVVGQRERDAAARQFERAVTTEYRLLTDGEDPFLLPRLDVFYFNRPGALNRFGGQGFKARVRVRAGLRQFRRIATG
jgi:peptidoglycan/xylan/chitin deacetylase (PgdA/CDA1 family)